MDAGLTKSERICSVKAIDTLVAKGHYLCAGALRCCFLKADCGNQIMVSVPKRLFKRAVKRNLLKRRIREAYRLQKGLIESSGVMMMFVYTSKEVADFEHIHSAVGQILSQINGRIKA